MHENAADAAGVPAEIETMKKRAQKRPETRIRDAVDLAVRGALSEAEVDKLLKSTDTLGECERDFAQDKSRAEAIMTRARARQAFGREVGMIDSVGRAMVRAGIEAARAASSRAGAQRDA